MEHVAIMDKKKGLISKILNGEKSIESRWYQTRRSPWNKVRPGDTVFFKDSGKLVTAKAAVARVWQFEMGSTADCQRIIKKYGKRICLANPYPKTWNKIPKYCILIELKRPKRVVPFMIHKKGFGMASAWITVPKVDTLRVKA